jgi:hypothetical protein
MRHAIASLAALMLAGCSASPFSGAVPAPRPAPDVRGGPALPRVGVRDGGTRDVGDRGIGTDASQPRASASVDQVCRTKSIPSGWIAVDYLTDAGCQTPSGSSNPYNVALIARYGDTPVGQTMVVCADQPAPRGWARETTSTDDGRCRDGSEGGGSRTVVIRRLR